jgi:hypothetical protein
MARRARYSFRHFGNNRSTHMWGVFERALSLPAETIVSLYIYYVKLSHRSHRPDKQSNLILDYTICTLMTIILAPTMSVTPSRSSTINISAPTAPSRNNPISLRIYKALGTTFDDPSSREALEIAASFYAPRDDTLANGDEVDGWGDQPRRTLKGQSAMMARRYLKRDVEMKLAESSQRFLDAFGEVDKVSLCVS